MQNDMQQLDLDFQNPMGNGYKNWQWDREEAVKRIAETWGLPLNRRVRLKVVNIDSEFEGKLCLAEMPITIDRRRPLTLRLAPLEFSSCEIEHCTVIE